ncbi:hypothetical protein THAOC_36066 [Thalassiosira oceanica]|uniref:Helicase-associated domain-containing protein n=1 Tax=Thalassiosira oceanica TaxID=159749 RepID=K0QZZ9_THAOC|nr:hypothetical protein THAOC_36066 [Thalassiosira oceanica]|eukprot:EJK45323.1 hypothetical protein THAOC_36066 [Thalassiosira oceanica]
MISKDEMSGAPALMIFAFWWTSIIAAPVGATEIARLWSADAFAHHRAGRRRRRTLPAPLPRTSTSRCQVTATPSSGPSLLLATKQSDTWELRYKELVKYKEEHGDCDVPQSMGALGDWVFNQRISYTKGDLAKERMGRLEDMGFTRRFVATDGAAAVLSKLRRWEELWDWRYRELKEYREKHGDCNVPQSQGPLGDWVNRQRQRYKRGKLSRERLDLLESIGFVWEPLDEAWMARFDELVDFKNEHGDCNVPDSQGPLGAWVNYQRQCYKEGKMSQERIQFLESIGFVWDQLEQDWSDRFDELKNYKDENGDCNVPFRLGSLGEWVGWQRNSYKKGMMSQERVDLLEGIGFVWEPLDEAWMARFDELVDFKNEHHDCNVPRSQGPLGVWVNKQRVSYKKGMMSQERIELLENTGFEWVLLERTYPVPSWKFDEQWKTRFTELVEYVIENGSCNVSRKYGPLGLWVGTQRQDYKVGRMSQFRIDYLESIGFAWTRKRVGNEWLPDHYSEPDPKAIARIIEDERPLCNDLPSSATEALKTRMNVGRRLAEVLQEYLNNDSVRLIQTYDKPKEVDARWQARYTELVHYLIEHGNCNVPRTYGPLGTWMYTQRQVYKDRRMSQFRIDYLDSIGFVWTTKRVGNEWLPDQYSEPDREAIARIIEEERSGHDDLPPSATEVLRTRMNVGKRLAEALQEYLDKANGDAGAFKVE